MSRLASRATALRIVTGRPAGDVRALIRRVCPTPEGAHAGGAGRSGGTPARDAGWAACAPEPSGTPATR
ncbi:hypothetical protein GCM10010259_68960 [Streptomyces daghestanicus]|uniref:Uncharacterized protein n=1 Tax=Streptomyces daghestanicus TaxID=66885 RepID=A0ABQ3PWT3_9ACTN|nr:hypothetical protein GCM10010259_68960 [Streptomyces daghestanicus]GHI29462.1 hypothetical protein Sdagh_11920 [Streptomyces daghestanicus]